MAKVYELKGALKQAQFAYLKAIKAYEASIQDHDSEKTLLGTDIFKQKKFLSEIALLKRELGNNLERQNKWAEAEYFYRDLSDEYPLALYRLAEVLRAQGTLSKIKEAEAAYRKVIAAGYEYLKMPHLDGIYYDLISSSDPFLIIDHKINPKKIIAASSKGLALLLMQTGKEAEAEQLLRQAITYDSKCPISWYNLGLILRNQKKLDEANAAFKKAEQLSGRLEPIKNR